MFKEDNKKIYLEKDGKVFARAMIRNEEVIYIDGIFVENEYRGQGIAEKLVKAIVEKAKNEGKKIVPICSYAVKEFERKEEYKSTLL